MHKFNGVVVKTPTSFSWDLQEIETNESGVTLDGLDHSDILAKKRVLSYAWQDPKESDVSLILQLVNANRYVNITYYDIMAGKEETRVFKPKKNSVPYRDLRVGKRQLSSLSLDFEER